MTRYTLLAQPPVPAQYNLDAEETVTALIGEFRLDNILSEDQFLLVVRHPVLGWMDTNIWGYSGGRIYEKIIANAVEAGLVVR